MRLSNKFKFRVYIVTMGATVLSAISTSVVNIAPILDDVEGTTETLKKQGFEPIEVGGGKWFGGSQGDLWRTQFEAINVKGDTVEGYATKGIFKGTTLRFD